MLLATRASGGAGETKARLSGVLDTACDEFWLHAQAQTGIEPRVQDAATTIGYATVGVPRPASCIAP